LGMTVYYLFTKFVKSAITKCS